MTLDAPLSELLGDDDRALPPAADAGGDAASSCSRSRSAATAGCGMLGDLGVGAILADDMGLGKTVQAIAMLVSEREELGAEAFGPTLVVCPMSVVRQWVARDRALRAVAARASRITAPRGWRATALVAGGARRRRRRHVVRHRDARRRRRSRASSGTGCCSTRRRT